MSSPCPTYLPGSGAYEFVSKEYQAYVDRIRNLSTDAAVDIEALESFTPSFGADFEVSLTPFEDIQTPNLALSGIPVPEYVAPGEKFGGEAPVGVYKAELDDGSGIRAVGDVPTADYGTFSPRALAPPTITLPDDPGAAPVIPDRQAPDAPLVRLPDQPSLLPVGSPGEAPEINIGRFDEEVPQFNAPSEALQDIYFQDHTLKTNELMAFLEANTVQQGVRDALNLMTQGGTGLPSEIEQALFDRARERITEDVQENVEKARDDWAARGFTLPGSTVLGAVLEARHQGLVEKGRINRELSVNFHNQEIENLRFVVQQGLQYETQLMNIYLQLDANARELANGHFEVMRGIYNVYVTLHEVNVRIFTAQITAYEAEVRAELSKIEAFRQEVEVLRLQAEVNELEIRSYEAQIRASLAQVQIFEAQINAFRSTIDADTSKIQGYRAKVDAYAARIEGLVKEVDVFEAEVRGEESRTRAFATTVDAYRSRVDAYQAQISAEATKTQSINSVVETEANVYRSQVEAWASGVNADTQRIQAAVAQFEGKIRAFTAELSRDETQARLSALGFDKELAIAQATVDTEIGNIGRALQQLTAGSQLELQKLTDSARINAQLAAASMAGLSISAQLSGSDTWQASSSSTCSTQYSASLV